MSEPTPASKHPGPLIIVVLVLVLLVLHQDNWFWTDRTLVFGFMPVGLFFHACISIAAALTWFLATKIAWPFDDIARVDVSTQVDASARADAENPEGRN